MQGVLINLEEMVKELVFPTLLKNGAKNSNFSSNQPQRP